MKAKSKASLITIATVTLLSIYGINLYSNTNNTAALEYTTNYGVNFTLRPSINVSLSSSDLTITDLLPNTSSDSNVITINVQSNNITGYVLNSSVGNNSTYMSNLDNLVNTASNSYMFTNLALDADLASMDDSEDNNVWGYSYSTTSTDDGNGNITWNEWSNYNGLPLYSDTTNIATLKTTNTTSLATGDNIRFKIAAKASSTQGSGEYTNIINFIAVGNPTPVSFYDAFSDAASQPGSTISQLNGYYKMQDMNTNICANIDNLQTATLIDVRDNNTYTVAKIAGDCWMTQNLRFSETTLDYTTSNVAINYTKENPLTITWLELKTDNSCYYNGGSGNGWVNTCMHLPNSTDLEATSSLGYTIQDLGAWYNYAGATVSTITGANNSAKAQYSVCPANWRLPNSILTDGEISKIISAIGQTPTSFKPIYGGDYSSGNHRSATIYGRWWSSEVGNKNAYRFGLDFTNNTLALSEASRYDGEYVRCIANN